MGGGGGGIYEYQALRWIEMQYYICCRLLQTFLTKAKRQTGGGLISSCAGGQRMGLQCKHANAAVVVFVIIVDVDLFLEGPCHPLTFGGSWVELSLVAVSCRSECSQHSNR